MWAQATVYMWGSKMQDRMRTPDADGRQSNSESPRNSAGFPRGAVSLWCSAPTGKRLLSTWHSRSFRREIRAEVVEEDAKGDGMG